MIAVPQIMRLGLLFFPIILLGACSTVTSIEGMTPAPSEFSGLKQNRETVSLLLSGETSGITRENFEQALADSISQSQLFSSIEAKGEYLLEVQLHKVTQPLFGAGFTITIDSTWKLFRFSDRALIWKDTINTTYEGGALEGGLVGANRSRVATEGAAQKNILVGIQTLGQVDLNEPD